MTAGVLAFPVHLPRHAFSPRDAARAGDVWRGCGGRTATGDLFFEHRVAVGDLAATATTIRRLADGGTDALGRA